MKSFLGMLFVFSVTNLLLIGSGVVIGYLLRCIFPGVDPGMGILIGVVTSVSSIYLLRCLVAAFPIDETRDDEEKEKEQEQEEEEILPHPFWASSGSSPWNRRRKRKRR